jgi:sec-independent protein translocase protein TatA
MPHLGPMELGIILLIVVLIFGVGKLPEIGSAAGRAIRGFKDASSGLDESVKGETSGEVNKKTISG